MWFVYELIIVNVKAMHLWNLIKNYEKKQFLSVNFFRRTIHSKSPIVNVAEPTWNDFSKQVNSIVQQPFVEITERLFKKVVPIHFINY